VQSLRRTLSPPFEIMESCVSPLFRAKDHQIHPLKDVELVGEDLRINGFAVEPGISSEPVREHIESSESFVIQGRRPDSFGGPVWTSKNRGRYDRSRLRYPSESRSLRRPSAAAIGVMSSCAKSSMA
jgi:hypothetical protein